jgi:hypothetical protein
MPGVKIALHTHKAYGRMPCVWVYVWVAAQPVRDQPPPEIQAVGHWSVNGARCQRELVVKSASVEARTKARM